MQIDQKFPFQNFKGIHVLEISPVIATFWVAGTPENKQRPLKKFIVKQLSNLMTEGKFKGALTNDLVQISQGQQIVNGQHRLNAIVESNTTQLLKVEFGVPWSSFEYADRGCKKTLKDDMFMSGLDGHNSSIVSAMYAMLLGSKTNVTPSLEVAKAFSTQYEDNFAWMANIFKQNKEVKILLQSHMRAAFVIAHKKFKDETEQFVLKYLTGANCQAEEAPLILRNTFLNGGRKGFAKDSPWTVGFKTLQALNSYINKENITRIRTVESPRSMYALLGKFTRPLFSI